MRARVVLRYADAKDLLISGLVEGAGEIAQHPAVVDASYGKGHVVIFSINPVWRGENNGKYSPWPKTDRNFRRTYADPNNRQHQLPPLFPSPSPHNTSPTPPF